MNRQPLKWNLLLAGSLLIAPFSMGMQCAPVLPPDAIDIDNDVTPQPDDPNPQPVAPVAPVATSVRIAGRVNVPAGTVIDGDTNDPNNPQIENNADRLDAVQSIPNPCTVGGYLGTLATGVDHTDVYRVEMTAGQAVTLVLADPASNDFDLFLYDLTGAVLASSEGVTKTERVTAPANGAFLVEVFAFSVVEPTIADTGGRYTLRIGAAGTAVAVAARDCLSSLHDFVEGEVLMKPAAGIAAAATVKMNDDDGWVTVCSGANAGGCHRLRIAPSKAIHAAAAGVPAAPVVGAALQRPASATIARVKQLRRRFDVQYAAPNYTRRAFAVPNDEFFSLQWHYPLIGLPAAWDVTTGSPNVIVAVIDTGVVLTHPDLQGQLVAGHDFVSDPASALDGDGIDPDPNDPGDSIDPQIPHSFHGTHVAGTIAARTDNGQGVAGVAWNVRIMPVRALGAGGSGTDFDIAQAIRFAAGLSNNAGVVPAQRADIINLSLGGPGFSPPQQDAISAARAAGVLVIAAAGNENANADNSSPAGLDGVVSVAAVDATRDRAPYSNFGATVDVAAPGGDTQVDRDGDGFVDGVLSCVGDTGQGAGFAFFQGTSMACPHVAGVAALMKSVNPNLTPADFDQLLAGTHPLTSLPIADDLGDTGRDNLFGHGLINALSAVQAAAAIAGTLATDTPLLQVTPREIDLDADGTTASFDVTNAGTGTLVVETVAITQPWISVTPPNASEGTYRVTVDRSGLADGTHVGSLILTSNGGELTVTVRLRVGTAVIRDGDVGTVYVLLLDPDTFQTVAEFAAVAADGYAFQFNDVAAGSYLLFAGTDLDNNGFISDEGEAFGAFPVLSSPSELDAHQDVSNVAFDVGFSATLFNLTDDPTADPALPAPIARRTVGVNP